MTVGPLSLVADLYLSGNPEVVAGNTAYRSDGTVLWRRSDLGDGFNATIDAATPTTVPVPFNTRCSSS